MIWIFLRLEVCVLHKCSCRLVLEYFCSRLTQPYIDCSIAIVFLVSNVFSKLFHRRTQSQIVYICFFSPLMFIFKWDLESAAFRCALPMGKVPIITAKHWWEVVGCVCAQVWVFLCCAQSVVQQHVVAEMCMEARLAAEHWWARCRAPLPPAVSQLGTSWNQDKTLPTTSNPPQGWTFQELVFPSVLEEEGSEIKAHGELSLLPM